MPCYTDKGTHIGISIVESLAAAYFVVTCALLWRKLSYLKKLPYSGVKRGIVYFTIQVGLLPHFIHAVALVHQIVLQRIHCACCCTCRCICRCTCRWLPGVIGVFALAVTSITAAAEEELLRVWFSSMSCMVLWLAAVVSIVTMNSYVVAW